MGVMRTQMRPLCPFYSCTQCAAAVAGYLLRRAVHQAGIDGVEVVPISHRVGVVGVHKRLI